MIPWLCCLSWVDDSCSVDVVNSFIGVRWYDHIGSMCAPSLPKLGVRLCTMMMIYELLRCVWERFRVLAVDFYNLSVNKSKHKKNTSNYAFFTYIISSTLGLYWSICLSSTISTFPLSLLWKLFTRFVLCLNFHASFTRFPLLTLFRFWCINLRLLFKEFNCGYCSSEKVESEWPFPIRFHSKETE